MTTPYDLLPYGGWSYGFTYPDVLATVARLRGLVSPCIEGCRVLEIGCAAGYNLIPMALSLPGSTFMGIDYAARQIEEGRGILSRLDAPNVTLHHQDLTAWDGSLGQFDYIIAHGIYSWVEPVVRDALLAICRDALAPSGVAYISYNTYPGWHMMEAMRRMMLYHIREIGAPGERAAAAKELIGFLVKATGAAGYRLSSFPTAYENLLSQYFHGILNMRDRADSLFLHDELEDVNDPCYFHEFLAHTGQHGLAYLADAEFSTGLSTALPDEVAANLIALSGVEEERGQYLDFVVNRTFRRSLLCHRGVQLAPAIDLSVLESFWFAAQARGLLAPGSDPEAASVEFVAGDGAKLTTDHPVTIVAMTHLKSIWPGRATLKELHETAYLQLMENNPHLRAELYAALTGGDPERWAEDRRLLADNFLRAYCTSGELLSLHTRPGAFCTGLSERPQASPWARWEAAQRATVTDLRLRRVALTPRGRYLLPLLDGSRTVADLCRLIEQDESEASAIWQEVSVQPPQPAPPHSREGAGATPPPQWGRLGGGEQLRQETLAPPVGSATLELPVSPLPEQIADTLAQLAGSGLLVA